MNEPGARRNRYAFGLGTIGRDMTYTLYSMYMTYYLTEILDLPTSTFVGASIIMLVMRLYDGFNDPFMGFLVDNTNTRFGKFKPWIFGGAIGTSVLTVLFFTDMGLKGTAFLVVFGVIYVFWEMLYTANDIAFWSMMPQLSVDQKTREKIGAFAKICASIGLAAVVGTVAFVPGLLGKFTGSEKTGFTLYTVIIVVCLLIGTCITLFGVKEQKNVFKVEEKATLRDMFRAITKNDQLLVTAVSMALFMIGYCTTTSFGIYFFKYAFKNQDMYTPFGVILILTQIASFIIFPVFSKRFTRRQLYMGATILVILGYIFFFFAPMNMIFIGAAGVLLFVGQAFISLLMLVFLTDTIEYGQWKLGRRNDSVTFAIQPFINKIGNAIGTFIVSMTLIVSGINDAKTVNDVTDQGLFIMKCAMLILPIFFIVAGYIVYRTKFKIDTKMYEKIVAELRERGDLGDGKQILTRPGNESRGNDTPGSGSDM